MKYQGSCHCKTILFEFEFESEIITDALQCNCSICIRKNAIMTKHYIEPYAFNLLKGEEHLAVYHWGDHDVNHYFCKNCGIYPFHSTTYEPKNYRVNLGCVDSVDPRNLTILYFDGKNQL